MNKKQIRLIKKGKYFSYKKKGYTVYNCLKKRKIAAISKSFIKDNNN